MNQIHVMAAARAAARAASIGIAFALLGSAAGCLTTPAQPSESPPVPSVSPGFARPFEPARLEPGKPVVSDQFEAMPELADTYATFALAFGKRLVLGRRDQVAVIEEDGHSAVTLPFPAEINLDRPWGLAWGPPISVLKSGEALLVFGLTAGGIAVIKRWAPGELTWADASEGLPGRDQPTTLAAARSDSGAVLAVTKWGAAARSETGWQPVAAPATLDGQPAIVTRIAGSEDSVYYGFLEPTACKGPNRCATLARLDISQASPSWEPLPRLLGDALYDPAPIAVQGQRLFWATGLRGAMKVGTVDLSATSPVWKEADLPPGAPQAWVSKAGDDVYAMVDRAGRTDVYRWSPDHWEAFGSVPPNSESEGLAKVGDELVFPSIQRTRIRKAVPGDAAWEISKRGFPAPASMVGFADDQVYATFALRSGSLNSRLDATWVDLADTAGISDLVHFGAGVLGQRPDNKTVKLTRNGVVEFPMPGSAWDGRSLYGKDLLHYRIWHAQAGDPVVTPITPLPGDKIFIGSGITGLLPGYGVVYARLDSAVTPELWVVREGGPGNWPRVQFPEGAANEVIRYISGGGQAFAYQKVWNGLRFFRLDGTEATLLGDTLVGEDQGDLLGDSDGAHLYIGGRIGGFGDPLRLLRISLAGNGRWEPFGLGLPGTKINDIAVDHTNGRLVVATDSGVFQTR